MRCLTSERLDLELLAAHHAGEMFVVLGDAILYRFVEEDVPDAPGPLEARYRMLERRVSPDGREQWLNWIVRERATGAAMGYVQATVRDGVEADVAYVFATAFQGRGFAREAVRAMLDELEGQFHVTSFHARVDARNARSVALLTACGFAPAGEDGGDLLFATSRGAPGSPRSRP
jgi:ribosomal-protein-alanine N-acetyltransferase